MRKALILLGGLGMLTFCIHWFTSKTGHPSAKPVEAPLATVAPTSPRTKAPQSTRHLTAIGPITDYDNQVVVPCLGRFIDTLRTNVYFPYTTNDAVIGPNIAKEIGTRTFIEIGPYSFSHYSQGHGVLHGPNNDYVYTNVNAISSVTLNHKMVIALAGSTAWAGAQTSAIKALNGLANDLNHPYDPAASLVATPISSDSNGDHCQIFSINYLNPSIAVNQQYAYPFRYSVAALSQEQLTFLFGSAASPDGGKAIILVEFSTPGLLSTKVARNNSVPPTLPQ